MAQFPWDDGNDQSGYGWTKGGDDSQYGWGKSNGDGCALVVLSFIGTIGGVGWILSQFI